MSTRLGFYQNALTGPRFFAPIFFDPFFSAA